MKRSYYETPKSGRMMRLFWKAAGGDRYILDRATYADQIKYMCLGGIVVTTGVMAALAGGYAFYTIFEPRGSALEHDFDLKTSLMAVAFGLVWGWIIFNIDRFIVTSTGKGDGTEAITMTELKSALPRIAMGAIIALTISKPVEIRMFKTEIDAELHEKQLELKREYEDRTRANFEQRLAEVDKELAQFEVKREDLLNRVKKAEQEHTDQLQGRAGAAAGDGRLAQALERIKDNLVAELAEFDEQNAKRIGELNTRKDQLVAEMDVELAKNNQIANGLDGLLERIKLAHEIAGFTISLFITLLFMAIELTPIFFKLMLTKTPYDYIEENIKELMKAEQGIYTEYGYYQDKEGHERDKVRHLNVEKINTERLELQAVQQRLTQYALGKYEQMMQRQIDADPARYVEVKALTDQAEKPA